MNTTPLRFDRNGAIAAPENGDVFERPIAAEKPPTAEETAEWAALAATVRRPRS